MGRSTSLEIISREGALFYSRERSSCGEDRQPGQGSHREATRRPGVRMPREEHQLGEEHAGRKSLRGAATLGRGAADPATPSQGWRGGGAAGV